MDNPRFKPFFVHVNTASLKGTSAKQRSRPRGFTAYVAPSDDARSVNVQVAFCSSKDNFVKNIGRAEAAKAQINKVNTRNLPSFLLDQSDTLTAAWVLPGDFDYLFKYMV